MSRGLVVRNTGSFYTVRTEDGQAVECKVKGNFRLRGIRSTNPVAVGDRVVISAPGADDGRAGESTAFITDICDRKNYIIRRSTNLSKQSHIIAANVDVALLIVTVTSPPTSTTFIDRFIASAEAYSIPVILVFNKTDILNDDERRYQDMMMTLYETVGYGCHAVSALTGEGMEALMDSVMSTPRREAGQPLIIALSGHSGVGKSSLINTLVPGANLRTAAVSKAHDTGTHTTTFSEMIELNNDAYLVDTPGIKGFGTFDMERSEIGSYFKEIFKTSKGCRFANCTHTHEPGCAVLAAVEQHYIAESRYRSYLSMLDDKDENKYREAP